jgi:hypothetical protein
VIRPGPAWLAPGVCPGGVVLRVYDVPSGVLVLERRLSSRADAEQLAGVDADFVMAMTDACCLVAWDGDSGQRLPREWFGV